MDPLSDVLSLLKPRSYVSGGLDLGGAWSLQFPQHQGIKCYAAVSGEGWLVVEGVVEPVRLKAGDCFLMPRGRPFRLASDPALPPMDALTLYTNARNGGVVRYQGGGAFFMAGAHFVLGGDHAEILLGALPPIVHIRKAADQAVLRWAMERMGEELREPRPGGFLVAQHLAHMMLVQALRLHLEAGAAGGVGWFFALADKPMRAAISAMHEDPARRWTLRALAERAGMSRTTFAQRFKAAVGAAPMEYLTRWRMLLAADKLANSGEPVSAIALALGYESDSAFSTAFKRVMGCSPRRYGRGRRVAAEQDGRRGDLAAERVDEAA